MALPSTLHKFEIGLSDVDRDVYETLSFRLVRHPSETVHYALVRVLAFALEYDDILTFGPGLCVADEPALSSMNDHGGQGLWLDVGAPSAERLHKASKAADTVVVYTHRDLQHLRKEWASRPIHKSDEIRVVSLPVSLLNDLEPTFQRNNAWTLLRTEGELYVTVGDETFTGSPRTTRIAEA